MQNSAADEDRVLGWAFKDNLELMREGGDLAAGSACWSRRWLHVLQSAPPASGTLEWLTELDEAAVIERAAAAYLRKCLEPKTRPLPKTPAQDPPPPAPSCTNKFAYYMHHIRPNLPLCQPAPHLYEVYDSQARTALSRFRTSCHDLRIERDRYLPEPIRAPPHERTCLQCASPTSIEDETHLVFHCPIYDMLRFKYADLFSPALPPSIACFLSQDQNRVASFINDCHVLRRRNACMSLAGSESAL